MSSSSSGTSSSATFRFVLQHLAPAMLPPSSNNDEEEEYYAILGLPKYSEYSEIRKRYKQLSLQYHPDKILQRGGDPTTTTAQYQQIQHAYSVLSDEHKRHLYHAWNCNVARYQFVEVQHGLSNPMALHENLTRASCCDKSRLMVLMIVVVLLVLVQPILIAVRVNDNDTILQSVDWIYIGIPTWIMTFLYLLVLMGITIRTLQHNQISPPKTALSRFEQDSRWTGLFVSILRTMAWWLGAMVLALKWDETISWDYNMIAIPFYVAVGMAIGQDLLELQRFHQARASMVSAEYLRVHENYEYQEHHQYYHEKEASSSNDPDHDIPENHDDDADEAELQKRQEILQHYIVITTTTTPQAERLLLQAIREQERQQNTDSNVAPTTTATGSEPMTPHEQDVLEEFRVQTSPEYKAMTKIVRNLYRSMGSRILTYVPTIALITAKVQDQINVSWWIVFIPIWIAMGFSMIQSCLVVCGVCCTVDPDDVVVEVETKEEANDNEIANDKQPDPDPSQMERNAEEENQINNRGPSAIEEHYDFIISDNQKKGQEDLMESGLFVAAEGDIQDFVEPNTEEDEEDEDLMAEPELDGKHPDGYSVPSSLPPTMTTTYEPTFTNSSTIIETKDAQEKPNDNSTMQPDKTEPQSMANMSEEPGDDKNKDETKTNDQAVGDNNNDKEEAEAFRKFWEEMQRQAEEEDEDMYAEGNAESAAFAAISCCMSCFQIMMLCLIVGKLEQAYDVDDEDDKPDSENGYNAFWILFPVFVVAGLILLCCACCIYAKVPEHETAHDDDEKKGGKHDHTGKPAAEDSTPSNDVDASPAIVIPLAATEGTSTSDHGIPAKSPTPDASAHNHSLLEQPDEPSSHSHVSENNSAAVRNNDLVAAPSDEKIADTNESLEANKTLNSQTAPLIAMDDLD